MICFFVISDSACEYEILRDTKIFLNKDKALKYYSQKVLEAKEEMPVKDGYIEEEQVDPYVYEVWEDGYYVANHIYITLEQVEITE